MNQLDLFSQCQRWRNHRSEYRPAGEPIDPSRYFVAPIKERDAKEFVLTQHYSGSYPAAVFRVGLFHKPAFYAEQLVGVAVFSVPCTGAVVTKHLGLKPSSGIELGRFVLLDKVEANGETWFLRRCFRLLRKYKSYLGVVAYCDPVPRAAVDGTLVKPGHTGTIYRAFNGSFVGRAKPRTLWLTGQGRVVSERAISKIRQEDSGIGYALGQLLELGAPSPLKGESGAGYVNRVKTSGLLRSFRHPGNYVFTWDLAA